MADTASTEERLRREIEHHRELSGRNPEKIWGWMSAAGRIRADRRASLYVEYGRVASGSRVLELGCGTGEFTWRMTSTGARLVALDLSAELLARAREKVGTNVRFLRGNAEVLPFSGESFDVVFGCSVLHHLDVETTLREVRRVLRRGGRLVFSEPNLLNPQVLLMFKCVPLKSRLGLSPGESAFTRATITRVLGRLGFSRFTVRYFDFLHPATPAFLVGPVDALGKCLEGVPVLRGISGSMLIHAER